MSVESETGEHPAAARRRPRGSGLSGLFLKRLIACVDVGGVTIVTPSGARIRHRGVNEGPDAVILLHRWRAIRRILTGGSVGFAEAYMDGDWSSPDLTALIELAAVNADRFDEVASGLLPQRLLDRLRHLLRRNSKEGSRRNIAFHYDLGNDFYRLWLDASMTYSAACYEHPSQTLEAAQQAKLARIVEHLDLSGGESILEIGCGWGALAARLAAEGATVTGLTLSAEQLAFARHLVQRDRLDDRVNLELQDYRDVGGTFDRIVSIEMFEAVGEAYWPTYFETLRDRLKPDGKALLQVITIDEPRFEAYRRGADFVQRYVFPGGLLPSKTVFAEEARRAGLRLTQAETFAESYAWTLAEWRRRFLAAWPAVERLGFGPSFRRLWEYYLCYCEAGFRTGSLDVGFYSLTHAPS